MRRCKLSLCAAVLLLAACDVEPRLVEPSRVVVSRETNDNFTSTFDDPCGGGTIVVSGTVVTMLSETVNANGVHLVAHVRARDVTAVGSDGRTYRATGGLNDVLFFSAGVAVQTTQQTLNLRGEPGSGVVVQSIAHVTVKDGVPVVTVAHTNAQCTGN